ncbi:MAG TPA: hypothetical protein VMZ91_00415 [Candidatus Paceibacterota bacterium]|nr:hypothetical protein [Candidatus Paceibacterota bacterium]
MREIIKETGLALIAICALTGLATKLDIENNNPYQNQIEIHETKTQEEKQNRAFYLASGLAAGVTIAYLVHEISRDKQRGN